MYKIVITGVNGFLGRHTLLTLSNNKNYYIYALTRNPEKAKETINRSNIEYVYFSFEEKVIKELRYKIKKADMLIHIAWMGVNREELDNNDIQKQNVYYSMQLLEVAKEMGIRFFVDYGSRAEYGSTKGILKEDIECLPNNAYGANKLAFFREASVFCKKNNIKYLHLRFFSVFGKDDHAWSLMNTLAQKLPRGESVDLGPCNQMWNFIPIEDTMSYVEVLVQKTLNNELDNVSIYNIASKNNMVLKDYITILNDLCGGLSQLNFGAFKQLETSSQSLIVDTTKLQTTAPINEIGFMQGFQNMIKENK